VRPGGAHLGDEADARSRRIDRNVLSRGVRSQRRRYRIRAGSVLDAGARARPQGGLRARAAASRRLLFLSAAVGRLSLQAPEPVSALDGPERSARSGRLAVRVAGEADRAARYPRHSRGPLPAVDAILVTGLADS